MWKDSTEDIADLETKANISQASCNWLAKEVHKIRAVVIADPTNPQLLNQLNELMARCRAEQLILRDLQKRVDSII